MKKRDIGAELLLSVQAIKNGKGKRFKEDVPEDIRGIREKMNVSQTAFAALLGVSIRTLQDWEQGRRKPTGPAQSLLRIAANNPNALLH
jgi:putative transcriptional regulator